MNRFFGPAIAIALFVLFCIGSFHIGVVHNLDFIETVFTVIAIIVGPYVFGYLFLHTIKPNREAAIFWRLDKSAPLFFGILAVVSFLIYKSGFAAISPYAKADVRSLARFSVSIIYAQPVTIAVSLALSYFRPVRDWMESVVRREMNIPARNNDGTQSEQNTWQPPQPPPSNDTNSFDPNRFKRD